MPACKPTQKPVATPMRGTMTMSNLGSFTKLLVFLICLCSISLAVLFSNYFALLKLPKVFNRVSPAIILDSSLATVLEFKMSLSKTAAQRELVPNEEETVEEFVFRILGHKILKLAIGHVPFWLYKKVVFSCRSVCRAWRDTVHDICFELHLPLFKSDSTVNPEENFRNLKSLYFLLAPPHGSPVRPTVLPPVSLHLDLACPPTFFAKKIEFEQTVFNCLQKMDRMLLKLSLKLPKAPLEGIDFSSLDLKNLKCAEFRWLETFTPDPDSPWQIVEDVIRAAPNLQTLVVFWSGDTSTKMSEFPLPKSLQKLQIDRVEPTMGVVEVAPTLVNLKELILTLAPTGIPGEEPKGHNEFRFINKLGKSLEYLEVTEILLQQPYRLEQPTTFKILEPMTKLRSLELYLSNWKVGELRNYKELLPSLTDLAVNGRWDQLHFPASWYSSPCFTLKRLAIHLIPYCHSVPPQPIQLLLGLSINFPNLEELEFTCDAFEGNNWQTVFCHGFPNLRKLRVKCEKVCSEGRNGLVAAVTGIPLEELQGFHQEENQIMELLSKYQHCPSLRNLTNLQKLKLGVSGFEEGPYGVATDSNVMIYSTFIQMPNLKLVELTRAFRLTDEAKQHARETTGLIIKSVTSRFDYYLHIPYN